MMAKGTINMTQTNDITLKRFRKTEEGFLCEKCGSQLPSYGYLLRHYQRIHNRSLQTFKGDFKCKFCDKKCQTEGYLNRHLRIEHPDDFEKDGLQQCYPFNDNPPSNWKKSKDPKNPWICNYCPRTFKSLHNTKIHEIVHRDGIYI